MRPNPGDWVECKVKGDTRIFYGKVVAAFGFPERIVIINHGIESVVFVDEIFEVRSGSKVQP